MGGNAEGQLCYDSDTIGITRLPPLCTKFKLHCECGKISWHGMGQCLVVYGTRLGPNKDWNVTQSRTIDCPHILEQQEYPHHGSGCSLELRFTCLFLRSQAQMCQSRLGRRGG